MATMNNNIIMHIYIGLPADGPRTHKCDKVNRAEPFGDNSQDASITASLIHGSQLIEMDWGHMHIWVSKWR